MFRRNSQSHYKGTINHKSVYMTVRALGYPQHPFKSASCRCFHRARYTSRKRKRPSYLPVPLPPPPSLSLLLLLCPVRCTCTCIALLARAFAQATAFFPHIETYVCIYIRMHTHARTHARMHARTRKWVHRATTRNGKRERKRERDGGSIGTGSGGGGHINTSTCPWAACGRRAEKGEGLREGMPLGERERKREVSCVVGHGYSFLELEKRHKECK